MPSTSGESRWCPACEGDERVAAKTRGVTAERERIIARLRAKAEEAMAAVEQMVTSKHHAVLRQESERWKDIAKASQKAAERLSLADLLEAKEEP